MDSQDRTSALVSLVSTSRKVTRLVKTAPFVMLVLFTLCTALSLLMPNMFVVAVNIIYGTVMSSCGILLVLSRLLKLCMWHKTACIIPSTSVVFDIADKSLFTFTYEEVCCFNILMFTVSAAFLVSFMTRRL